MEKQDLEELLNDCKANPDKIGESILLLVNTAWHTATKLRNGEREAEALKQAHCLRYLIFEYKSNDLDSLSANQLWWAEQVADAIHELGSRLTW